MRAAREDASLRPVVVGRRTLRYADGGDLAHDRTPHVRAASGLAWLHLEEGPRLVLAQDDTSFVAVIDPEPAVPFVSAIALEHRIEGRRVFEARLGNKKHKLDLEACTTIPFAGREHVLIVGSGSLPVRERFVLVDAAGQAQVLGASRFFAALRAEARFSGSELNLEGAVCLEDGTLVLFQRGNGALAGGLSPVDATCTVSLDGLLAHLLSGADVPAIERVTPFDLGAIEGVRLTFTDATRVGERIAFLAGAEASPNAVDDGAVAGAALGTMATTGQDVRWGRLRDADGAPYLGKAEGLAPRRPGVDDGCFWAVTDRDDPDAASELLAIEIR